jgi:hypothetical protein
LFDSLIKGNVVFFVGAGVSTESSRVFPYTFYEDVRQELKDDIPDNLSFPDLMSAYCKQPNGRANLLRKIKERLQYVSSFPELYREATRFHRELSTIPFAETFVSTNWDTYLEEECGAAPFITAEDFAFAELPGRKVFKLHGSVQSYGSIIATREDYEACYARLETGLLGSKLKLLLATKTIIYVGFSFRDDDFIRIHRALTTEMRGLRPQAYLVSPEPTSESLQESGVTAIRTDGTFFVSKIKERLVSEKYMLPDSRLAGLEVFLDTVVDKHHAVASIDLKRYPDAVLGFCYQDGLIHALEHTLSLYKTGRSSAPEVILKTARRYECDLRVMKLENGRYDDVAYIDGYVNGLLFLLADDQERKQIPVYYAFGHRDLISSLRQYRRVLGKLSKGKTKPHRWAVKVVAKYLHTPGIEPHHTPFLL